MRTTRQLISAHLLVNLHTVQEVELLLRQTASARQKHEEEKGGGQYGLPQRAGAKGNGALGVSHAWQNDLKASVDNTWQNSPFRRMLLVGAFVLNRDTPESAQQ